MLYKIHLNHDLYDYFDLYNNAFSIKRIIVNYLTIRIIIPVFLCNIIK